MERDARDRMLRGYKDGLTFRYLSPAYSRVFRNRTKDFREYVQETMGLIGGFATFNTSLIIASYTFLEILK